MSHLNPWRERLVACLLIFSILSPAIAQDQEAELAEAQRLSLQANMLHRAGRYAEAVPLAEHALAIREKVLGPEDVEVATSLTIRAALYRAMGDDARAAPLLERALAIREKGLGKLHPDLAVALTNLAALYRDNGNYALAGPLFQRALTIREKALLPERNRTFVADALNELGTFYSDTGEYARAESLFKRALTIREEVLGPEHKDLVPVLTNLALLYRKPGLYVVATSLLQRALAIREKSVGPEHPLVAISLNNLAALYQDTGEYLRAESLLRRALAIREKALGPEHPSVAITLNNLAELYRGTGDYAQAAAFYHRSLAIKEKVLGPAHPSVAISLSNLAALYQVSSDVALAVSFNQRASEIEEAILGAFLSSGSQRQKQLYLDTLEGEIDSTVSLHIHAAPQNAEAARLALTTILRRKGRALDAFTSQLDALRSRAAQEDRKALDDLAGIQSKVANLQLGGGELTPDAKRAEVARLIAEQEKLEDAISRRSAQFRVIRQPVTLAAVQAAVPPDAALAELFVYRQYNAKAKTVAERFGVQHYVAYVVRRSEAVPQFVDLGEAESIDADAARFRNALKSSRTPETEIKQLGRNLDARLMQPIRKLLGSTRRVLLAPDGALNLIPFEALVDEDGRYLIENYSFNYLTSGRDLLRLQITDRSALGGSVVIANPQFDLTRPVVNCRMDQRGLGLLPDAPVSKVEYRGIDFTQLCYSTLAGTEMEAAGLAPLLGDAKFWLQLDATEAALKSLRRPRVLHIATHGFFLPDKTTPRTDGRDFGLVTDNAQPRVSQEENPLLRSGLILAGVNQKQSGLDNDGVLTALEAAGLDLFGTKLVVLSACETGLGDVQNGQGVYGLRRAFVLAGSETQIMSLWKVSDAATQALMVAYYKRLQAGEGRVAAMRAVQLEMLRGTASPAATGSGKRQTTDTADLPAVKNYHHPYYWAAFIPSGDWRSLESNIKRSDGNPSSSTRQTSAPKP
jgi:CHAT domain-containing protein/Tfp pilus assembly protein PilF